jgi:NAD(P)-dependent dehydrogenase (short-subunit alcohol dehydrogenase family)
MFELTNKVAIVTGASSGIGRAAAKLFAAEGAKVVVTARRRRELERLIAEIEEDGGAAVALAGDGAKTTPALWSSVRPMPLAASTSPSTTPP